MPGFWSVVRRHGTKTCARSSFRSRNHNYTIRSTVSRIYKVTIDFKFSVPKKCLRTVKCPGFQNLVVEMLISNLMKNCLN